MTQSTLDDRPTIVRRSELRQSLGKAKRTSLNYGAYIVIVLLGIISILAGWAIKPRSEPPKNERGTIGAIELSTKPVVPAAIFVQEMELRGASTKQMDVYIGLNVPRGQTVEWTLRVNNTRGASETPIHMQAGQAQNPSTQSKPPLTTYSGKVNGPTTGYDLLRGGSYRTLIKYGLPSGFGLPGTAALRLTWEGESSFRRSGPYTVASLPDIFISPPIEPVADTPYYVEAAAQPAGQLELLDNFAQVAQTSQDRDVWTWSQQGTFKGGLTAAGDGLENPRAIAVDPHSRQRDSDRDFASGIIIGVGGALIASSLQFFVEAYLRDRRGDRRQG